ncbi:hypothetical protein [Methanoculleus chikugoensis]|uniref:hypothetical protein n=1 Tax=Methanoculleus chikugoensis TaxID=118126 RepID=UPI001FB3AA8E|nr:hypothetical protein [Methanoculleus chikugoensis]
MTKLHESGGGAKLISMRVGGRTLRKSEVLGLFIFILMAVVMFAVGAALFCAWLAEPGSAPAGTPADIGPIPGGFRGCRRDPPRRAPPRDRRPGGGGAHARRALHALQCRAQGIGRSDATLSPATARIPGNFLFFCPDSA